MEVDPGNDGGGRRDGLFGMLELLGDASRDGAHNPQSLYAGATASSALSRGGRDARPPMRYGGAWPIKS